VFGLLVRVDVHGPPVKVPSGVVGQTGCEYPQYHGVASDEGVKVSQLVIDMSKLIDEIRPVKALEIAFVREFA
jgi:hypothetical protein